MKYLYQNKHWRPNKEYNIDKILYLMVDRPDYIATNYFNWKNKEYQIHRDYDLPSFVGFNNGDNCKTCNLYWDKNGKQYRINNKPSYIDYENN